MKSQEKLICGHFYRMERVKKITQIEISCRNFIVECIFFKGKQDIYLELFYITNSVLLIYYLVL